LPEVQKGTRVQAEEKIGYANFGQRALALLIDFFLVGLPPVVLIVVFAGPDGNLVQPAGILIALFATAWAFVGPIIILILPLRRWGGQTLGKRILGIKVNDLKGGPPTLGQCLGRTLLYFVSYLPGMVGFLWCIWDEQHRCFHDMIAHTLVVKKGVEFHPGGLAGK
jgi:uncharacterized RDD family membrane protein YckC